MHQSLKSGPCELHLLLSVQFKNIEQIAKSFIVIYKTQVNFKGKLTASSTKSTRVFKMNR
jgi:hypothetical protein